MSATRVAASNASRPKLQSFRLTITRMSRVFPRPSPLKHDSNSHAESPAFSCRHPGEQPHKRGEPSSHDVDVGGMGTPWPVIRCSLDMMVATCCYSWGARGAATAIPTSRCDGVTVCGQDPSTTFEKAVMLRPQLECKSMRVRSCSKCTLMSLPF